MTDDVCRVLVVDDDPGLAQNLQDILQDRGYSVSIALNGQSALALAQTAQLDLALVDVQLPDKPGNMLVHDLAALQPNTEFVIMTGYGSLDTAREAVKQKRVVAYETKPLDLPRFLPLLDQVVQRRQAERALRAQEQRLQLIVDHIVDLVAQCDEGLLFKYVSPSYERTLGYGPEELLGTSLPDLIHPEDREQAITAIAVMLQAGSGTVQYRCRHKDGHYRWIESTGRLMTDDAGGAAGAILASRDITAHMQADEERAATVELLKQSEMRFRTLFEHASVPIFEADLSPLKECLDQLRAAGVDDLRAHFDAHPEELQRCAGLVRILDLNKEALANLGAAQKGGPVSIPPSYLIPESWGALREMAISLAAGNTRIEGEVPIRLPNGETRTINWRLAVVPGHEKTLAHLIGSFVDITERRRMQEDLAESEARLRRAVLNAPFPIIIHAEDGRILLTSQALNELSGYRPEEIPTMTEWMARAYGERQGSVRPVIDNIFSSTGPEKQGEFEITTARGQKRTWDFSSAPLGRLPDGSRLVIGMAADVTERKKLEDQLRQAVKMEAIGRLAGGVAHDFNNLLTVIEGRTRFAMDELPASTDAREDLEEVLSAAQRAASLTRQLLAFSRRQVLEMRVLDMNQALRDMNKMLARLIGEDIVLHLRLIDAPANVRADLGQIEQVIVNLAVNARDAMPQGGILELETSCRYLDEAEVAQRADLRPGNHVLLTIRDTGCGMSAEVKEHLFEPFFTTKGVGKGTGLGLATIYGIIKQSGGDIDVTSKPGLGTTFHIYLPQVAEASGSKQTKTAMALPHGTETVLVAEDQAEVRRLTVRMLRSLGYRVLEAALPADAIRLSQASSEPIQLIISDVVMPGMSGPQLVEYLRASRPDMRVLYVSGYTDEAVEHYGLLPGSEVPLLQKPFTLDALSRQVRAVLDAAQPA